MSRWALSATDDGNANEWWSAADALARLPQDCIDRISVERERAERALAPASQAILRRVVENLCRIGARVSPGMASEPATRWATETAESLRAIPDDILMTAANAATLEQFRFLNEVGPWIAEEARPALGRRRIVSNRLAELERSAARRAKPEAFTPCTPEQIEEIKRLYPSVFGHGSEYARAGAQPPTSAKNDAPG